MFEGLGEVHGGTFGGFGGHVWEAVWQMLTSFVIVLVKAFRG